MDDNKIQQQQPKASHDVNDLNKRKPDEIPSLNIEARLKIFDKTTGEVLVKGRG
jgi:hypothetical protein